MRTSRSWYRVLLRMCPPDLRAEFGAEMEALFLADLARARGFGKARVWARAITDVLRHGPGARAKRTAVMRQVLGEGAVQAAIGLAIGLGASVALMQGLRSILFGVEPGDPLTLLAVAVSLMLVALIAVTVPALRAMRIDPVTALREQ